MGGEPNIGTATVMFTDLVGSTEIRSRVGEDAAETLRVVHDEVLGEAISANGGVVVKHLGDGLMATFPSAAGAVAAAVAMQQELDQRNRRNDGELMQVRVGISTGDVTFDGNDCFGLPVVEAQRLEASAEPATIRCAEMVMLMARGRGGYEFAPLGDLELKGLAEPLAACEVLWSPIAQPEAPTFELGLPPVFAHAAGLPFSGRDDVFEQLVDAWKRCVAGGFEVILLAGEPGIGKTRLAQELAVRVHGGDGRVIGGRCDEDVTTPFQAFAGALDFFVRQTPPDRLLGELGEFPGDLIRIVPELDRLVDGLPSALDDEPDVERYRLFQAVGSWLSVGGTDHPRLVVLDDLHWADKPTLLLLRHLISNPPVGLMILCTYRDTDVDRTHPLSSMLADFRRMPAVDRIALDGLGDHGVRELLTRTGGHELDDDGLAFADVVQRETSGNPFFLGEVLRHLAETGALYERDGRWVSDLRPEEAGIPEGIREVVGRRLSRLGDDVETVLRSAAVIGYEFDVDLLADVTGRDAEEVLDALEIAARANLVIEVGVDRHRFAHALVRETLHGELSSSRRARQHRRVAEALETRHADDLDAVVAELATHWAEASAGGDPSRAIELAIHAGDLAADRGAFENAVRWFQQALELMEDESASSPDRRRTLVKLAKVQIYTGAGVEARDNAMMAARSSLAADDLDTACEAMAVSPRASFDSSDPPDPERTALLREVLAFDELDVTQRARMLGHLATELIFERDIEGRAAALAEFGLLSAGLSPLERVQLNNAGTSSYRAVGRGGIAEILALFAEAARLVPQPSLRMRYLQAVCFGSFRAGDRDSMEQSLSQLTLPSGPGANFSEVFSLLPYTMSLTTSGDLEGAATRREELVEGLTSLGAPEATVYDATTMMALARETGTVADLDFIADLTEQMGHPASAARAIGVYIRWARGDVDRVTAALDLISTAELADDAGYPVVVAYWSEIVAALGITDQCRRFIAELEPASGTQLATGGIYLGSADRYRALLHDALGDHEVADELFAAAAAQHEAFRTPPWIARTHLDWAESLIAREQLGAARVHLDAARAAIGNLDLPDNQRRLDELDSHG